MVTRQSGDFLTNREWFKNVLDEDVILCHTSALECLELFNGYMNENNISVYSKKIGKYQNINYIVNDDFDNIEKEKIYGVYCTSIDKTFNDMLENFNYTDEQALIIGLSNYYYLNGNSFDGLKILPKNANIFNKIKDDAIEYYTEE